jgi:transposase InsO family protein
LAKAACESFIKTLKYEEVYRTEYRDLAEARASIGAFLEKVYNQKRLHSALVTCPRRNSSAGCSLKPTRRPLRGSFPYEFSQAWGNLSFR